MLVEKEVIRESDDGYWYINRATGLPAKLHVDSAKIKHYHDSGKKMLAAELSIPVPMEHDEDCKAMTKADAAAARLKNNAGFVRDYYVKKIKDDVLGKEVDALFAKVDITDRDIAKKIPDGSIPWSSPWIDSFTDGDKTQWDEVVSHLALTTRPRIKKQEPIKVIALSMTPETLCPPKSGCAISRAGLLIKKDGKLKPRFPMAFSLLTGGVFLSKEDIKGIRKADEDEFGDEPPEREEGGEEEERGSPLDAVPDTGKDVSIHETIGHLLKALGFSPPDGMDESTFERDIYETLMAKVQEMGAKHAAEEAKPKEEEKPKSEMEKSPIMQENPPMYLSLEEIKKIQDPEKKKMASAMFSIQQNLFKRAADERTKRIDSLLKKRPFAVREAVKKVIDAAVPSAKFSMSDDGAVSDSLEVLLNALEADTIDVNAMLTSDHGITEIPHPEDAGYMMTPERAKAIAEEVMKNTGGEVQQRQAG